MTEHALERLFDLLVAGDAAGASALLAPEGAWDDPLFRAAGELADWCRARGRGAPRPLRTTADPERVAVEALLPMRDGLVWNQAAQRAEKAELFELPVAAVADRASDRYSAIRIYFGTWSVTDGAPKPRLGPIAPDRGAAKAMAGSLLGTYFELLARGDAAIVDCFEPDGYFREPANNYACGRDQLEAHFSNILKLGGVGVELLTATCEKETFAFELQTIAWGPKRMPAPQAGFASYDLGRHGKLAGARVYDSVVPPEL